MAFKSHSESIGYKIPACAFGEHLDAYSGIESRLEVKKRNRRRARCYEWEARRWRCR